jgi:hypothetical protein
MENRLIAASDDYLSNHVRESNHGPVFGGEDMDVNSAHEERCSMQDR